ncbi:hypothetical protein A9Q83_13650 [Alphaproteobacteria bacterium 46_93_T64]|nr:hypothetical protein A9Q83_13650 [Alphaproteobacteria bacterium 46_93_T64]
MGVLRPQSGSQENFLSSSADIAIYGGAAGGGKSYALLLEPLRHIHNPKFRGVIFRRTSKQIRNEGGLWDTSRQIYSPAGGIAKETDLLWRFPSGATISFGAMEHEKNRFDWQGTEITYLGFDELTHFTERQFFYLLSRNRSTSGIAPYVRATCNPDADSWVAGLVNWWIDQNSGYALSERSATTKWFVRDGDEFLWKNNPNEFYEMYPDQVPKSVTFVAASVDDNKILLEKDKGYKSNLGALDQVERERLLKGNWKIRPAGGLYFRRNWFPVVASTPTRINAVRGWDLAATSAVDGQDKSGDWSAGALVSRDASGRYYVEHVERFKGSPKEVEDRMVGLAVSDGKSVKIAIPQDPGQAGKAQAQALIRLLSGYRATAKPVTGSKVTRSGAFSAQVEAGNVLLVQGEWNDAFLNELQSFPNGRYDDQVDAVVEAFSSLQDIKRTSQREMYA